jgi:DNA-directed RNA polymerase subunit RPC12/RpoP
MTPRSCNNDFRCIHCGNHVSAMQIVCGVHNRNHCPYCLWSRHLDLFVAGDRLSACKAPMHPLGLTMKPGRNKYAPSGGEMMLVHICVDCGRVSLNRIAADDDAQTLMEVFAACRALPFSTRDLLVVSGIRLLNSEDIWIVQRQLLGANIAFST